MRDDPPAGTVTFLFTDVEGVVVDGALRDPKVALRLIDAVDPPVQAELEVRMPTTAEEVENLSLAELRALVEHCPEPAV
jgi:hypothetical protein